ncbi:MAG: glycosyltransferase family 2 protein [Stenotrophomonas sp.]|uniref:glycosyltransferase family 2 protein n=1 Tax=Stenotrophomonas sp. TaxID=69392 RepID=UPI003D6D3156
MGTIVLLPIGVDDSALDRCLAALDAGTPAGTPVWLADDGQAGPRAQAVIEHWLANTPLHAEYTRRARAIGEVAHLDEMLRACAGSDVVVLAPDAVPAPGWLQQLEACCARDASIGSATPWCNAGETAAWPRLGEINPAPDDLRAMAEACAALPALHPELPSAVTHAVLLRANARRKAGGLDMHSYASWNAALIDLSLRMAGLGWRNALCETAFVARAGESQAQDGDMEALATRWPAWQPRLASFLMGDPLLQAREALQQLHRQAIMPRSQGDLFGSPAAPDPESAV